MSVKKPHRGTPALDMTAMVDVAFLLLTFFILTTTKFREDQSVQVDSPSSVSQTKAPETSLTTIYVTDSGQVFVGFSDIGTRQKVLANAVSANKIPALTDYEMKEFAAIENFGVPYNEMKGWLALQPDQKKKFKQKGIPASTDSTSGKANELKDWIYFARYADPEMKYTIKGDKNATYSVVEDVMKNLRLAKINHFGLITNLEAGTQLKEGEAKEGETK